MSDRLLRALLWPIVWPFAAFCRWIGCPLEGGQGIDLNDSGEWMTAEEWRQGPKKGDQ